MRPERRVILLEFNELSPSVMDRFMALGKLPNFRRLYSEAAVYVTDAGEEPPNLEPWIQWVTVHSGLPYREHRVFRLGEGHKLKQKCIWDVLSDAKFRVAVCGSMNVRYDLPLDGYVLPDPWTYGVPPYPETLAPYYRFVQLNVQEYTNDRIPLTRTDYAKFVGFMTSHGLSLSTAGAIMRQLLAERGGKHRWRRAALLDKLQFDLFRWFDRRLKPHFSTFFLNSTAHLQHMHWRNMEPELFKVKPTAHEQAEYEQAVLFGYQEMDRLVGGFLELADGNTTLVFCTALGQQPCLTYEDAGGKTFYRPVDFGAFLAFAGVRTPHQVTPVMSEHFQVHFNTEQDAREAEDQLRGVQLAGHPAMFVKREGNSVFSACEIFEDVPRDAVLSATASCETRPFFDIFYQIEGKKSGMHHPDGMLWIRKPSHQHTVYQEKVPLTSIAPTILEMFGVRKPEFVHGEPLERIGEVA